MMTNKILYIIRHGKSSWEMEFVEDIDRPLMERGVKNAYTMGKRIAQSRLIPEYLYSSPAIRALHTAVIMARVMKIPENRICIKRDLYMSYQGDIIKLIETVPDEISRLAIFGHNPSFTSFANRFLKEPIDNLPTAGVAAITFNTGSWKNISPDNVIAEHVDFPRKQL